MSYSEILEELAKTDTQLIAVSKTKPDTDILTLYEQGQLDFGENKVQELQGKFERLPQNIRWHLIGHLQTNKVKYIAAFVHMIHSVDSLKLCKEIQKQAGKHERKIKILLQLKIAQEESKYGISAADIHSFVRSFLAQGFPNIELCGLMGMATFTEDESQIESEFQALKKVFGELKNEVLSGLDEFKELSMGMSADFPIACRNGSTMVRIGSLLFGARNYG